MDPPAETGVHLTLALRPQAAPHRSPGWLGSRRRPAAVLASGALAGAAAGGAKRVLLSPARTLQVGDNRLSVALYLLAVMR